MSSPIRAYRKKHRLSQREIASVLNVSRSLVQSWETGDNRVTAEMAVEIEDKLGIDRMLIRPDIFRKNGKRARIEQDFPSRK